MVETSAEWITTQTGIMERHCSSVDQATSDMVVEASKRAIKDAGIKPEDIELIIVGTISPDNAYPSTGNWVQKKLGIKPIPSFDISAACSGFLYGLILADTFMKSGTVEKILVVGAESMTKVMNWEDRDTCVLFGDGAGAAVLGRTTADRGIVSTYWGADGNLGKLLLQPAGGSAMPASMETVKKKLHTVHMNGDEVFKHAVLKMQEASEKAIELANLSSQDIDLFIPHQANIKIIEATIKQIKIPLAKTFINLDKTGNMSAASIPVALDQARKQGRLKPGHHVLMSSFGAGFTWSGVVVKF